MNPNRLAQFWRYTTKVFDLPQLLAGVRANRPQAEIPTRVLTSTLVSAAVLRIDSLLDLQTKSESPGWQKIHGWSRRISDDALAYGLERFYAEDLRQVQARIMKCLKTNKQLEECRINGLLFVALDANEQFNSRSRCCDQCSQREITIKNAAGEEEKVTEFYHRQVYARLCSPKGALLLDVEPMVPGEEECQAALRLLGRMRRIYGPRFFDAVTVDAWYTQGPWIRAVQKLGWGVVCVLKRETLEIYKETDALLPAQPTEAWKENDRTIELREVTDLNFTTVRGPVRVVVSDEAWKETHQIGGKYVVKEFRSQWRWIATEELAGYGARVVHTSGHGRWGIENQAFNVLTKYYHLTHCAHHHPEAILARLLFLILGYVLFDAFVRLHGKLLRLERWTLKEMVDRLRGGLERPEELIPLWSG